MEQTLGHVSASHVPDDLVSHRRTCWSYFTAHESLARHKTDPPTKLTHDYESESPIGRNVVSLIKMICFMGHWEYIMCQCKCNVLLVSAFYS